LLAYSCLTLGVHLTMGLKLKPAETRVGYLIAMVTQTGLTISITGKARLIQWPTLRGRAVIQ
jgi:hypothetical protein